MAQICWAARPFFNFDEKRHLSKPYMTKYRERERMVPISHTHLFP
jgi:hypothetical protein